MTNQISKTRKKLLIIDGNSILNRAYWGIRPLTAPDGTPTNAVYGFLNIMLKHLEEESYDYLCVAFDVKEKTFRHKRYEKYKAQRKPAPEDFLVQLPLIKEVLEQMNCMCLEKPGYEADDIIGTVAGLCDANDIICHILTGDKDDLQLISDTTSVKLVVTKGGKSETKHFGTEEFKEKYGITPAEFIDVKALMGDTSDNIPGVSGVGEKTALSLIQSFGSVNGIYNNIDEIDIKESVRTKLKNGRDDAYLSYELVTIDTNMPLDFNFEEAEIQKPKDGLGELLLKLNFKTFIKRLKLDGSAATDSVSTEVISADGTETEVDFETLYKQAKQSQQTVYVIENSCICVKPKGGNIIWTEADESQLKRFFADKDIKKVGYDIKEDITRLFEYGIDTAEEKVEGITFDVMLAAYILDPTRSQYPLDELCVKYLSAVMDGGEAEEKSEDGQLSMMALINDGQNTDSGSDSDKTTDDKMRRCFPKVYAIERLADAMADEIKNNGQEHLYYDIELPLTVVLARLQLRGMYVDRNALTEFGKILDRDIERLAAEIYKLADEEFNINSPKQLGVILFEKLKIPYGKKGKKGSYSTSADKLEKLREEYEIVELVLSYRQLTKLKSTYVTGLSAVVNADTGRIHSHFNQTVTNTGRLSSTEPNLQNIPVRTQLGKEIRRMFTAEKQDWSLIDADYSQIELRVLAHIADDKNMRRAFIDNCDIHTQTAATVFNIEPSEVTSVMRSRAKAVNFGIVYGIGAFSLAKDIGISRNEAQQYIKDYLESYGGVSEYMDSVIEKAKADGYITTILGRRRYLPELKSNSHMVKAFGERVAMNAPIQGSAADIIKIAMVNTEKRLAESGLKARLVLQVHDELIVEAPDNEVDKASAILKEEMESAFKLSVPLTVDMNSGKSWYDTK